MLSTGRNGQYVVRVDCPPAHLLGSVALDPRDNTHRSQGEGERCGETRGSVAFPGHESSDYPWREPERARARRTGDIGDRECVVSALAWWLIPLVATILAVAFVALRSRPEKPATPADGMDRLRRMQQAMERPMPSEDPATGSVRPFTPGTPDPHRPQDGE